MDPRTNAQIDTRTFGDLLPLTCKIDLREGCPISINVGAFRLTIIVGAVPGIEGKWSVHAKAHSVNGFTGHDEITSDNYELAMAAAEAIMALKPALKNIEDWLNGNNKPQ